MNYKNVLQTHLARRQLPDAVYTCEKSGVQHAPVFYAKVIADGRTFTSAMCNTKKDAENDAAHSACQHLGAVHDKKMFVPPATQLAVVNNEIAPTMVLIDGENVPFSALAESSDVGVWVFVQKNNPQKRLANRGEVRPTRTILIDSTAKDAVDVAIVVQATLMLSDANLRRLVIVTGDKIGIATIDVLRQMFDHAHVAIDYASSIAHCALLLKQ